MLQQGVQARAAVDTAAVLEMLPDQAAQVGILDLVITGPAIAPGVIAAARNLET